MKFTKNEILTALSKLGAELGFDVNVPKANSDEGDPEGTAIVVHFNEADPSPLNKLVEDFGGVDKVREALTAAVNYQAKANAEAEAAKVRQNELVDALSEDPTIGLGKEELAALPLRALEAMAGIPRQAAVRVNYAALSAGATKANQSKIAPRPSILLAKPGAQTAQ